MKTTRILLMMALIVSVGMQAEAKKVKLLYNLKAGDQFKYEKSISQDIVQEMMGQSQATTSNTSMTYEFRVTEVTPSGDMRLDVALVAFAMASNNPMGEMKYDSEKDSVAPDFAKTMAITLNEVYSMTLTPLGEVTDIKTPEGLVEKVTKLLESMGGAQMAMASGAAAASVSADGFKQTMVGLVMAFPKDGAQVKEPWELDSKINQMISLNTKTKFELVKSNKETNELKVTSQITMDPDSPGMEMQGMTITYELMGASDGTILLEPATGLIRTSESVSSISGTISVDSPQLPSPMSIPMTIKSTEKVTRK